MPSGLARLGMPPFTKMLGPWIAPRPGKTVTRRQRTTRIISELIEQLPSHAFFKQHLPAVWDYALPFQFAGYGLGIDQTFEIDHPAIPRSCGRRCTTRPGP
jgi:hypothetical protein